VITVLPLCNFLEAPATGYKYAEHSCEKPGTLWQFNRHLIRIYSSSPFPETLTQPACFLLFPCGKPLASPRAVLSDGERLGVTPQLAPSVGIPSHHDSKQWPEQEGTTLEIRHPHEELRPWRGRVPSLAWPSEHLAGITHDADEPQPAGCHKMTMRRRGEGSQHPKSNT
jgi:hypothetical protein